MIKFLTTIQKKNFEILTLFIIYIKKSFRLKSNHHQVEIKKHHLKKQNPKLDKMNKNQEV